KGGGAPNKTSDNNDICGFLPQTNKVFFDGTYYSDTNLAIKYRPKGGSWTGALTFTPIFIIEYANGQLQGCCYATGHLDAVTDPSEVPKGFFSGTDSGVDYHTRIGGNDDMVGIEFLWNQGDKGIVEFCFYLREKEGNATTNDIKFRIVRIASEGGPETEVLIDTTTLCNGKDVPNDSWGLISKSLPGVQFLNGSRYRIYIWAPAPAAQGDFYVQVYDTKIYDKLGGGVSGDTLDPYQNTTFQKTDFYSCHSSNGGASWVTKKHRDVPFRFYIDEYAPEFAILQPAVPGPTWRSSLPVVSGTARDTKDGIVDCYMDPNSGVEFWFRNISDGKNWDGTSWVFAGDTPQWISTGCPVGPGEVTWQIYCSSWNAGDGRPYWEHNVEYRLVVRVKDSCGNYAKNPDGSIKRSTATFIYDIYWESPERPDSLTTSPSDGVYVYGIDSIGGTAVDNTNGGINFVYWWLQRQSDKYYWNNTGGYFQEAPLEQTADASPVGYWDVTWSKALPALSSQMTDGTSYYIWTKASDKVQSPDSPNVEIVCTTITVTCDRSEPESRVTLPNDGDRRSELPTISGTAYDQTAGVDLVELRIKRNSDNMYWNSAANCFDIEYATAAWFTVLSGTVLGGQTTTWVYAPAT
ncbi:MAG: hypothetical protein QME68_07535, partial [Elusimicrobiota bacterium]|nr:hypothetical protein [Elusimicrobiota bacterium]